MSHSRFAYIERVIALLFLSIVFPAYAHGYDVHLSVPFKAQVPPGQWTLTLNCGQTSVVMVTSYYHKTSPTEQRIKDVDDWLFTRFGDPIRDYNGSYTDVNKLGILAREFFGFADAASYTNWTLADLRNELNAGHPVIVAVWTNMNTGRNADGTKNVRHFMVLVGMSDDVVIVNDPGHTHGNDNFYPLSQFQSAWASQNNAVVAIPSMGSPSPTPTPTPATGTERTQAILDGQPWIGNADYTILGPNGVLFCPQQGCSVPTETPGLAPGQYTFTYNSGGPPNSTFTGVGPSSTQTLTAGGTITFTLQFASLQPTPTPTPIPAGERAYLTKLNFFSVSVIDTSTNQISDNIPTSTNGEWGIAVHPSGKRIYTSNFFESKISVIDVESRSIIATIPLQPSADTQIRPYRFTSKPAIEK